MRLEVREGRQKRARDGRLTVQACAGANGTCSRRAFAPAWSTPSRSTRRKAKGGKRNASKRCVDGSRECERRDSIEEESFSDAYVRLGCAWHDIGDRPFQGRSLGGTLERIRRKDAAEDRRIRGWTTVHRAEDLRAAPESFGTLPQVRTLRIGSGTTTERNVHSLLQDTE